MVVVVLVSVVVQGALVPTVARLLQVRMRTVELEPFSLGVRLPEEPHGAHRVTVVAGAAADGRSVADLPGLAEGTWVSLVLRDRALVPVRGDLVLRPGDEVLVLVDAEQDSVPVCEVFTSPV